MAAGNELLIRSLNAITAAYAEGFEEQLRRLLELGCARFGTASGALQRVQGGTCDVVAAAGPGAVADELCLRVRKADGPVDLECGLGAPVRVRGDVFGVLCFVDPDPREESFGEDDFDAIQLLADWIAAELHRQKRDEQVHGAFSMLEHTRHPSLVGELVGAFKHELNNALCVAVAGLDRLKRTVEHADELDSARRALTRIGDVLDELARLARDHSAVSGSVELAGCIQEIIYDRLWQSRFRTVLRSVRVHAPAASLYQAFYNIVFAHVHADGSEGPVRVGCRENAGRAEVVVQSRCRGPLTSVRSDMLAILRGRAPLCEAPLSLAEHVVRELDGELSNVARNGMVTTTVRLPLLREGAAPVR